MKLSTMMWSRAAYRRANDSAWPSKFTITKPFHTSWRNFLSGYAFRSNPGDIFISGAPARCPSRPNDHRWYGHCRTLACPAPLHTSIQRCVQLRDSTRISECRSRVTTSGVPRMSML
jgi:hypothetical protein